MAWLSKPTRIIKLLTPEMVARALAEYILVHSGLNVNRRCRVETQFAMKHYDDRPTEFKSCRVEVEVE